MISISLTEYETRIVDGLEPTSADLELAESAELQKRLRLRWLRDGRLELAASSHVGVVELDCVRISIVPKLVGGELAVLQMVDFVTGTRSATTLSLLRMLPVDGIHLRDLVCSLVTTECEQLLRRGLRRDYVRREEALTAVRGRLMVERQVLRRFGRLDRLECRFDEFDADVMDNRICSAALDVAARTARDGDVRARARVAAADFAVASPPGRIGADGSMRAALHYDRHNEHYRAAHRWSLLLLGGGGIGDLYASSGDSGAVFLINMNALFEHFVTAVLRDAAAGRPVVVRDQYSHAGAVIDDGTNESYMVIRPDILLVDSGEAARVRPVDAKYKLYGDRTIAPGDIYQACLYAQAFGAPSTVPTAILIHPTPGPTAPVKMSVRGSVGEVKARVTSIGIDVPDVLAAIGTDRYQTLVAALLDSVLAA